MSQKVAVTGLRELDQALADLGLSVSGAKGVLRRTGRRALEPFDAAWRAGAPRLTGHLERSGGIGSKLTKRQRSRHRRESAVEIFAGPGPDPAAIAQEFGTADHAPQPFVRPAWDATKDEVLSRVREDLAAEITKTATRQARKAARLAAKG